MKFDNLILRCGLNKYLNTHHKYDDTICFFDSGMSSLNVGDEIINSSGLEQLNKVFSNKQIYKLSTHDGMSSIGIHHANLCEERIVCGSNLMCDTMFRSANWNISAFDIARIEKCTLMGVGWNRYGFETSKVTKFFYNKLLHNDNRIHSVRDAFTKNKMELMGFKNVINTGCPTIWKLTNEHCSKVNEYKVDSVIFTITDYNKDYVNDKFMINTLMEMYDKVYFWPQGSGDRRYLNELGIITGIIVVPPQLEAYDKLLKNTVIDFVGTRLHGGIRALQNLRRTLIIGIDNRALEKTKDFNLPVLHRDNLKKELKGVLNKKIHCNIRIKDDAINTWLKQFTSK